MPYFDRDGISIFYIDEPLDSANQPVALLIHGWTCDLTDWSFQLPFLHRLGFRTIAYDLRGHGHSAAKPPGASDDKMDLRFETVADDGAALLAHLNITKPVVVFGHSMGGMIASVFTLRHPELSKALVVIDSPYYIPAAGHTQLMAGLDAPQSVNQLYTTPHEVISDRFHAGAYGPLVPEWIPSWHDARRLSMPGSVIKGYYLTNFANDNSWGSWEGASVAFRKEKRSTPRLVVVINDERVELETGLGLGELDHVQALEGGHWFHQSNAEAFNNVVEKWLRKLDSSSKN